VQGVVLMRNCPLRSQGEVKEGGYWDTGPINRVKEPLVLILGQAPSRVFLHISPKRYIPAQIATAELTGTRDNPRTIASKSMNSGDFLNS
jgi:hypothetical protein